MSTAIDLIRSAQGMGAAPVTGSVQDELDALADMGAERCEHFARGWGFYSGEGHDVRMTDRLAEFLERTGTPWRENFCEPMVDLVSERLRVTGFEVVAGPGADDEDDEDPVGDWLADWWRRARLDEAQDVLHTVALAKGESFGIVDWDPAAGRPVLSTNHPEHCRAHHDDHGRMTLAVKRWATNQPGPSNPAGRDVLRLNVYRPDRIEKWFRPHSTEQRGGWARWIDTDAEGDRAPWPAPWVDEAGEPLGIPVVHFRNRPLDGRGRSELVNVIPQQMTLNKQTIDLLAVLDNHGFPQRWVTGLEPDKARGLRSAPGGLWVAELATAEFGQFPISDLAPILDALENTISRMARRSGMPLHLLTGGDIPSGEAMKTAESRLIARVENRQLGFGNAWEDAATLALRLAVHHRTLGEAITPDALADLSLSTVWRNPASRDEFAESRTYEAHHRLGASRHTLLTRLGYEPRREAELRAEEDRASMLTANRALNAGLFGDDLDADDDDNEEARAA